MREVHVDDCYLFRDRDEEEEEEDEEEEEEEGKRNNIESFRKDNEEHSRHARKQNQCASVTPAKLALVLVAHAVSVGCLQMRCLPKLVVALKPHCNC